MKAPKEVAADHESACELYKTRCLSVNGYKYCGDAEILTLCPP